MQHELVRQEVHKFMICYLKGIRFRFCGLPARSC